MEQATSTLRRDNSPCFNLLKTTSTTKAGCKRSRSRSMSTSTSRSSLRLTSRSESGGESRSRSIDNDMTINPLPPNHLHPSPSPTSSSPFHLDSQSQSQSHSHSQSHSQSNNPHLQPQSQQSLSSLLNINFPSTPIPDPTLTPAIVPATAISAVPFPSSRDATSNSLDVLNGKQCASNIMVTPTTTLVATDTDASVPGTVEGEHVGDATTNAPRVTIGMKMEQQHHHHHHHHQQHTQQLDANQARQCNAQSSNFQSVIACQSTRPAHTTVPSDPEARRNFIRQKAIVLKSIVRRAMKSIDDHRQVNRHLSILEAQTRKVRGLHQTQHHHHHHHHHQPEQRLPQSYHSPQRVSKVFSTPRIGNQTPRTHTLPSAIRSTPTVAAEAAAASSRQERSRDNLTSSPPASTIGGAMELSKQKQQRHRQTQRRSQSESQASYQYQYNSHQHSCSSSSSSSFSSLSFSPSSSSSSLPSSQEGSMQTNNSSGFLPLGPGGIMDPSSESAKMITFANTDQHHCHHLHCQRGNEQEERYDRNRNRNWNQVVYEYGEGDDDAASAIAAAIALQTTPKSPTARVSMKKRRRHTSAPITGPTTSSAPSSFASASSPVTATAAMAGHSTGAKATLEKHAQCSVEDMIAQAEKHEAAVDGLLQLMKHTRRYGDALGPLGGNGSRDKVVNHDDRRADGGGSDWFGTTI